MIRIGMEMPLSGMPHWYSTHSSLSQGVSIRYMYNIWKGLSVGVAGGAHFCNKIGEQNGINTSICTYSFKNYYVHALLHYKVVDTNCFMFALSGSAGLGYVDSMEKQVAYSSSPNSYSIESEVTEEGKMFHYLFGAETAYRFTKNVSASLEYKYDIKFSNHIVGIGVNYGF